MSNLCFGSAHGRAKFHKGCVVSVFAVAVVALSVGCSNPSAGLPVSDAAPELQNRPSLGLNNPPQQMPESVREATDKEIIRNNSSHWYQMARVPGKPGMLMLRDGEMIAETAGERAAFGGSDNAQPADDSCPNPNHWSGNTPPSCTNTGAFRRLFSNPGNYWLIANVTFPAFNPYMPTGPSPLDGDTGYVYLEGWPGAGTNDSEGGFVYSAVNNWYSMYLAAPGHGAWYSSKTLSAGSTVSMQLYAFTGCSGPCVNVAAWTAASWNDGHTLSSTGWSGNCCIFATMTTIAQSPVNVFHDGAQYGPFDWSGEVLCDLNSAFACTYPTFLAGSQRWPNDLTKVITFGSVLGGETQKINLHS